MKRGTLNKSWSKWLTNGTTKHSHLAALKPMESSSWEETARQKSSPTWKTAWCYWVPSWATGRTVFPPAISRTVIANTSRRLIKKHNSTPCLIYSTSKVLVLILAHGTAWIILFLFHYPLFGGCVGDPQLGKTTQHVISHLVLQSISALLLTSLIAQLTARQALDSEEELFWILE